MSLYLEKMELGNCTIKTRQSTFFHSYVKGFFVYEVYQIFLQVALKFVIEFVNSFRQLQ